ncbi:cupin domain-containing protein [Paraburkholderia sediminicola]|nr:cupin domain-containing protein [Paraburkholderia sediminicola]
MLKVVFPPDSVFASSDFDPGAAGAEYQAKLSGLAEAFEQDNPGMHRTDSLDYAVVLDGEIWLELDDSRETHLVQHDIVVQTGTRHAWRNRSNRSATMLFVLLGKQVG